MSRLLSNTEQKQKLYDLFGQNYLDGDKPEDWAASVIDGSVVKDFIDDFVVPLIKSQQQAWGDYVINTPIDYSMSPLGYSKEIEKLEDRLRNAQRQRNLSSNTKGGENDG